MVLGIGGSGVGRALAAVPQLFCSASFPETDADDDKDNDAIDHKAETPGVGKVIPVTIRWRNINCSLSELSETGRLLAIMGPSGSGKTTLLNVLAGQLAASPRLRLSGLLEVNGSPSPNKAYKFAYVRQEDLFSSQLTVRETLSLAAELQLPEISSSEERLEYVSTRIFISRGSRKWTFYFHCLTQYTGCLAHDGHTVICSINQPTSSVYGKFDDIVLLTEGALHTSQKRVDALVESFSQQSSLVLYATRITRREVSDKETKFSKKNRASRDGPTNKVWSGMSIASAIIFASVFWRMGISQTSIQDGMGLLQFLTTFGPTYGYFLSGCCINTAMAALTKTLGVFPKERAIVNREHAKGSCTLGPYLLSKLLAEIPVGSAFPLMFGSGTFTYDSFSCIWRLLCQCREYTNRISAFQGLCINEFRGLQFDHQHSYDIQNGEQALERIPFGGRHIRETMVAQSRILLFRYSTTYLLLPKNKPKYQLLEATPLDQIQPAVQLELLNTEQDEQNEPNEVNEQPVTVEKVELNQPSSESSPIDFVLEGLYKIKINAK
ncbi:ABC transporter G family member 7 [Pyrus ussuriensis x Pyrus communis]|uniref:ABC transporter G family member 7 n=1 Tax=Pyrus ussuriensis x Pyrus communis TaxID=2448454 RepID=A0A5N5GXX5_9ROSA|nr:ABC transporter G family member 7 [Pyrus ussuriensis x Pyrus communis]